MNIELFLTQFITFLMLISIASCTDVNPESPTYNLALVRNLHEAQRDHHFNKDSVAFAEQMSKDFVSVNGGFITTPSKEESITRYNRYFSSVEFEKWDDVSEPVFRFSDDSTMAYTIVDKIVALTYPDSMGNTIRDETHFAWTTVYTMHDGEWKIDCVTSTRQIAE